MRSFLVVLVFALLALLLHGELSSEWTESISQEQLRTTAEGTTADGSTARPSGVDFSKMPMKVTYAKAAKGGGGKPLEHIIAVRKIPSTSAQYGYANFDPTTNPNIPFLAGALDPPLQQSFFVWLAVTPDRFWVNLKPHERDKIMDPLLAVTFAGQVMLEADLQLKKSVGEIIHPDHPRGDAFWTNFYTAAEQMATDLSTMCFSFRQWVVPGEVSIVETEEAVFLVSALLDVQLESEYVRQLTRVDKGQVVVGGCPPDSDPRVQEVAEQLFRQIILPELIHHVNTRPEYANLRFVYYMRVLAEWFRQQVISKGRSVAFGDIVDQNRLHDAWKRQSEWDPLRVWDDYVTSVTRGEFDLTKHFTDGIDIYARSFFYGGVDLRDVVGLNAPCGVGKQRWMVDDGQGCGVVATARVKQSRG